MIKSATGAFIDVLLCESSVEGTMFEGLLFDDLDGIQVEELNMQPSIIFPASDDKRYVWKLEDDYVAGIVKIKFGLHSESKTVVWQTDFTKKLVVSDVHKVTTQCYTIRSLFLETSS